MAMVAVEYMNYKDCIIEFLWKLQYVTYFVDFILSRLHLSEKLRWCLRITSELQMWPKHVM